MQKKTIWNATKKKMKKIEERAAASERTQAASRFSHGHVQEEKLSENLEADETSHDEKSETFLI